MKTFALLLMISSLSSAFAKTKIVEIVPGDKPHEDHMVMWSNGKVTYVSPERAKRLPAPDKRAHLFPDQEIVSSYEPTIVESMEAAQTLLNKQRKPQFLQWNIQCVTPMVHVKVDGKVKQMILDREWSDVPLEVKPWTDKWMKNKATCPVITKFSTYEQNQETESCYRYPAPMYYWQPIHLIELEESGQEMSEFKMSQVKAAYSRDF